MGRCRRLFRCSVRAVKTDSAETGHAFLDVRDMEPPEPLMQVLARIDALGEGQYLHVHHRREPCLLYPNLEQRGFDYLSYSNDSDFHIFIWRKEDAKAERAVRIAIGELSHG